MDYYRTKENLTERSAYDESLKEQVDILEALSEKPVTDSSFHRFAVLFYAHLYDQSKSSAEKEYETVIKNLYESPSYSLYRASRMIKPSVYPSDRLKEMIAFHTEHYYLNLNGEHADPVIDQIRRTIR
jgi:hypothetical protein